MCNHKRSLSGIGIISLLCFIINIPHFFTYEPVHERNLTDDAYVMTEFGKGHGSQSYEFWVHCMFLVLVPWVTIFCLNLMIIKQVLKTGAKMSDRKSVYAKEKTRKAENQLTTLLLTVTFTFLVLIALQCITQCFFMLKPKTVSIKSLYILFHFSIRLRMFRSYSSRVFPITPERTLFVLISSDPSRPISK